MRNKGNKAKAGRIVRCPKCHYSWRTKQRGKSRPYICCSRCKRYFKQ